MTESKVVKNLMIDVFEYPHIPFWFTIKQAIMVIKKSIIETEKCFHPLAILIFDEKYNLLGTVTMKDIMKGLEPRFMRKPTEVVQVPDEESSLYVIWDTLFTEESKLLAEKQIGDIMIPAKFFVEPDDPITKAAYIMISHDLGLLPVLADKKKFVGIVRMIEIFDELSNVILKE
ncbi:MAG: CBS domain-containing protein [Nitrospirae bacterium]|nr:CBS domain-containing protein [Nitrospirota bacterium]